MGYSDLFGLEGKTRGASERGDRDCPDARGLVAVPCPVLIASRKERACEADCRGERASGRVRGSAQPRGFAGDGRHRRRCRRDGCKAVKERTESLDILNEQRRGNHLGPQPLG